MKPSRKFNHQQYLRDLQEVQLTLQRVRSSSRSVSRINRSSSQKILEDDLPIKTTSKDYSFKHVLRDDLKKSNDLARTRPKAEWNTKGRNLNMLGQQARLDSMKETKYRIDRIDRLDTEKQLWSNIPLDSVKGSGREIQVKSNQNLFVKGVSEIYQIEQADSREKLQLIVKQIQRRDKVFKVVESAFPNHDPKDLGKLLKEHFERERLMAKIIKVFKAMSKVDIDDLQELYDFLRDQQ